MNFSKNTFSLAHAAHLIGFPGKSPDFIFWLRSQKYLTADLKPQKVYLDAGYFIAQAQVLPGSTKSHRRMVVIPRVTSKGLDYLGNKFNGVGFPDPKTIKPLNVLS